jgi:nitrogen-specific signal transduction histidine kinase
MPVVRLAVATPGDAVTSIAGVAEGAGLAHDAGNLLGALSLYSDLLAMPGVLHEEHREYAAELRMLSDRSWAMINRLVNHSRAGLPVKMQPEISVLPDVVDRCKGLLGRVAGRTVEVSYGVGAFQPVRVPVEAVERILTNLVKNAAEATPWVGSISIHVEGVVDRPENDCDDERRRVVMTVRDPGLWDGPGDGAAVVADGRDLQREWPGTGVSRGARAGCDLGWVPDCGEPAGGGNEYFCGVVCGETDGGRVAAR